LPKTAKLGSRENKKSRLSAKFKKIIELSYAKTKMLLFREFKFFLIIPKLIQLSNSYKHILFLGNYINYSLNYAQSFNTICENTTFSSTNTIAYNF